MCVLCINPTYEEMDEATQIKFSYTTESLYMVDSVRIVSMKTRNVSVKYKNMQNLWYEGEKHQTVKSYNHIPLFSFY